MASAASNCQIPGLGLKTCPANAYLTRMLQCTPILKAGAAGRRWAAWPAGGGAPNQLLIDKPLSNIYQRETFRQHCHASLAASAVICGFGPRGDRKAALALAALPNNAG
jgi:Dehydroquinase class II